MEKYKLTIKYSCGHENSYMMDSPQNPAVKTISAPCDKCRAEADKKRLTRTELNELKKPLQGTEKQIQYAELNRERFIKKWVVSASDSQADTIRKIITHESKASWWMDNYQEVFTEEFINNYTPSKPKKTQSKSKKNDDAFRKEQRKEEIKLHTLYPKQIKAVGQLIYIELKDSSTMQAISTLPSTDELKDILKTLRYSYISNEDKFIRDITEYTGNYSDRAAETGIALLDAGYAVTILNSKILNMIRKKEYMPENTNWVKYYNSNSVYLDWEGYEKTLCSRALAFIQGAHWNNDYKKVVIPADSFPQILEYAKRYHFSIDNKALKLLENRRRRNMF